MLARFRREHPDREIHWLIVTEMKPEWGFSAARIAERNREILSVEEKLRPLKIHRLGFPPARLDALPLGEIIEVLGATMRAVNPDTILVPWRHDVHTDHRVVFDAVAACTKAFRNPTLRTVLAYETVSETEFSIDPGVAAFRPNTWVDISRDLAVKLDLLACYPSELGKFPFPRSAETVSSLARLRGSAAGVEAAEAFVLLKGIL